MDPSKSVVNIEEVVQRLRKKLGRQGNSPLTVSPTVHPAHLESIDWHRIGTSLKSADEHRKVWTTTPNVVHYQGPIKWLAMFVGKIVLYFNQVVTKPQEAFNNATAQSLSSLSEGLNVTSQNILNLQAHLLAISQALPTFEQSIASVATAFETLSKSQDQHRASLQKFSGEVESLAGRLGSTERRIDAFDAGFPMIRQNIEQLASHVESFPPRLQALEQQYAAHAELESRIPMLADHLQQVSLRIDPLEKMLGEIGQLSHEVGSLRQRIVAQEQRIVSLLEEARKRLPKEFDKKQLETMAVELEAMDDALYLAFEDQFRGTREEIKERVRVYLPTIQRAGAGAQNAPVLDVGCGRGEWLELLAEQRLHAHGVDINQVMVKQCQKRKLNATHEDVMRYLADIHNDSLGAVTGFHIIEHLPFATWVKLFDEAFRVLKQGGVAIFETPNSQNVIVGSHSFYLDPTHRNPLPSEMVSFIARERGFGRVEILNLHAVPEPHHIKEQTEVANRFNHYFYGPLDYAVIAWKL